MRSSHDDLTAGLLTEVGRGISTGLYFLESHFQVEDAGHSTVELFDTVAPRLIGFGEPSRFTF